VKAVFVRRGDAFYPIDEDGRTILNSVKDGRECMGEFRPARNPKHWRLYQAILKLLVDNEIYANHSAAELELKIVTGEWDTVVTENGRVFHVPRSTSYEKMDQATFKRYFDRMIYWLLTKHLIGANEVALRDQIMEMIDRPENRALGRRVR
jgi:hypothetical protein